MSFCKALVVFFLLGNAFALPGNTYSQGIVYKEIIILLYCSLLSIIYIFTGRSCRPTFTVVMCNLEDASLTLVVMTGAIAVKTYKPHAQVKISPISKK